MQSKWQKPLKKILYKTKEGTLIQVIQVRFAGIGFLFETNISISLDSIFKAKHSDNPLGQIPQVEQHNEKFKLLAKMNTFVID